jgi:hypothetical protein
MFMKTTLRGLVLAALVGGPGLALADSTTPPAHVPLQKTIGQVSRPVVVPSLIVMNADGAVLADGKLTLTGVATNSIVFADRPVRAAGHAPTTVLIEEWGTGDQSFAADPPNATVSVFGESTDQVYDVVVVLKSPVLDGSNLTFDVDVLEGDLTGASGAAAVFIDIIGRPLTPVSYAGVARRTADRAAWYGGAAAVGTAAAVGAAAAQCGYYPYPPCP